MITDFGVSIIFDVDQMKDKRRFGRDVIDLRIRVAKNMLMGQQLSPSAQALLDVQYVLVESVERLLKMHFFTSGQIVAPMPKTPSKISPLLKPEAVQEIGYLPQRHPSGMDLRPRRGHSKSMPPLPSGEVAGPSQPAAGPSGLTSRVRKRMGSVSSGVMNLIRRRRDNSQ
jgi:hypothetical protein